MKTASCFLKPLSLAILFSTLFFTGCEDDETTEVTNETSDLQVNNYVLVATGQTDAYDPDGATVSGLVEGDELYGQDRHYQKGTSASYTDNGDGTVTDNVTGLMWQQTPSSENFTWDEAVEYCENLELGGYDDWRMPTVKELFSISDFESGWPYINMDYFDLATDEISKDEQYWANNKYVGVTVEGGTDAAFGVNHVTGHIKAYAANATGPVGGKYVRAVRGDTYGTNDFTENGDSTITDNATGLMWSQYDSDEGMNWADALAYAENSELAGYTDWRLPNIKELQSIADYTRSPTATDADNVGPALNALFKCTQIINEAGNDDYPYYWSSTSAYFSTASPGYYYAWYYAAGRAVNNEGDDFHGAGAVRFDTKDENGPAGEDAERYYNYVFLVRDAD
ncbi:Lcl C-terminal domain-containing protein [Thermophagus sp. OGC60D27]|uniref:Lcl C-terminal domain-containing protein n=1 Tax=Thermophagus sp. OGC60D27 TaxID=3458415 RepID=UPI004037D5BC